MDDLVAGLPEVCPGPVQIVNLSDPDLARLVSAWPELSPPIKAAILALLGVVDGG